MYEYEALALNRVKTRLKGDDVDDVILKDYIKTLEDRICLRLSVSALPDAFISVVVDGAVKMYRRRWYEGIESENDEGLSSSFVDDVLSEYEPEFTTYLENKRQESKVVRFL